MLFLAPIRIPDFIASSICSGVRPRFAILPWIFALRPAPAGVFAARAGIGTGETCDAGVGYDACGAGSGCAAGDAGTGLGARSYRGADVVSLSRLPLSAARVIEADGSGGPSAVRAWLRIETDVLPELGSVRRSGSPRKSRKASKSSVGRGPKLLAVGSTGSRSRPAEDGNTPPPVRSGRNGFCAGIQGNWRSRLPRPKLRLSQPKGAAAGPVPTDRAVTEAAASRHVWAQPDRWCGPAPHPRYAWAEPVRISATSPA